MKRIVSFLLAILLMLSLLPVSTMAAELPESRQLTEVNPAYSYLLKPEDLHFSKPLHNSLYATTYYTSTSSAGAVVRNYLENRSSSFSVGFRFSPSDFASETKFDAILHAILSAAWEHTGIPTQGDYLRYQIAGWGIRGYVDSVDSAGNYNVSLNFNIQHFTTPSQEATVDNRVDSLLTQLNPIGSDYQKLKTVYDWICANITYDTVNVNDSTHLLCHSAYAALIDRTAVCQGYTMLLYRLALEMGIDSRAIPSIEAECHIWNILKVGNYYYNADATWDAGLDPSSYDWFLRSNAGFPRHTRDAEFTASSFTSRYPIGPNNYDPADDKTPLQITQQPKSVTVPNGETAITSIKATGEGLTYRWFVKMPGSSSFLKGTQTGTVYSVQMNSSRNGMKVYCKVTDKYGETATSETVTLSQAADLVITQQPKSVTVANGATAKTTVKATGDTLKYQWFVKMPGSSSYVKGSQTGTTYSVKMTDARSGMKVCCKITDKYGRSKTSEVATLLQMTPLTITQQPTSVTVLSNETVKTSIKATGDGLKYQWFVKMPGSSSFQKGSQTGTTYSVKMNDTRNGMQVCCKVTDKYGNSITSSVATLRKAAPLVITQQPVSVTVVSGETAKTSVKATGEGLKYQWFVKMPGSSVYQKGSQTGTTYAVQMNASRSGMKVCCKITDKYGRSITSSVATLMQVTPLTITQQPQSITVPVGETARTSVKAAGEGLTYQWYVKMPDAASFVKGSQTGTTYAVQMTEARDGMQIYCKITDRYGKSIATNVVTLKAGISLAIIQQPRSVTVPNGSAATVTLTATGEGLQYQWYYKDIDDYGFTKSSRTGNTYSVTMSNACDGRQVYCVISDRYGKSIVSNTVTLRKG